MGFEEAAAYAARKTKQSLEESGQIPKVEKKTFVAPCNLPDEFTSIGDLFGLPVKVTIPDDGLYFMGEPKVNKEEEYIVQSNGWFIANNYGGGVFNKRCMGVGGELSGICPTFYDNYPGYEQILYVYEETGSDLVPGVVLPKGWYAISKTAFTFAPFNLEDNPIIIKSFDGLTGELWEFIRDNWFTKKKEISFKLQEKNVYGETANKTYLVCFADISNLTSFAGTMKELLSAGLVEFNPSGRLTATLASNESKTRGFSIETETITPISQKYLPSGGGGGLPVVEIEEMPVNIGDTFALTGEPLERVKAALATGDYCIIYFMDSFMSAIARRMPGTDIFCVCMWMQHQYALFAVGTEDGTDYFYGYVKS